MKKILILLFALLAVAFAQSPESINFQTVVRDNMGVPMVNQNLSLRLRVRNDSVGPFKTYYTEEFANISTDNFGYVNVHIGTGTPDLNQGDTFSEIEWGAGTLYLHMEVNTGNGYTNLGYMAFTSVPGALHANIADSVKKVTIAEMEDIDLGGLADGNVLKYNLANERWEPEADGSSPWSLNGNKIYYNADNVGIGTSNPTASLTLGSSSEMAFATHINPPTSRDLLSLFGTSFFETDNFVGLGYETYLHTNAQNLKINERIMYHKSQGGHRWYVDNNADGGTSAVMLIDRDGFVDLKPNNTGASAGAELHLHRGDGKSTIDMDGSYQTRGAITLDKLFIRNGNNGNLLELESKFVIPYGETLYAKFKDNSGLSAIELQPEINRMIMRRDGDAKTTITIDADENGRGRITTDEILIKGGADFAERFELSLEGEGFTPLPGMVVSIDPAQEGNLQICTESYDHKVAGIISGGGGIAPGMVMGQEGSIADGQWPVALSGRVYVLADEKEGNIKPGDLLTSSSRPGYAMKANDAKASRGAIIGKAMTKVNPETGMVLVLVSLQ